MHVAMCVHCLHLGLHAKPTPPLNRVTPPSSHVANPSMPPPPQCQWPRLGIHNLAKTSPCPSGQSPWSAQAVLCVSGLLGLKLPALPRTSVTCPLVPGTLLGPRACHRSQGAEVQEQDYPLQNQDVLLAVFPPADRLTGPRGRSLPPHSKTSASSGGDSSSSSSCSSCPSWASPTSPTRSTLITGTTPTGLPWLLCSPL